MNNIKIDVLLITKYLAGEAAPEEAMAIGNWITKPANKEQFDEISGVWNAAHQGNIYENQGRINAWLKLEKALLKKTPLAKIKILPRVYAAASIVAAIILCSIIYYRVFNNHPGGAGQKFITLAASNNLLKDTLPDGSIITLNRNSVVQYPENFIKTTRRLSLRGEAYFNVAPDKKNPFIITDGELSIRVVGTLFDVRKKENPYSIEVQVQSGIVKMYTSKNEITLTKDQTGIYMIANDALTITNSVDANSMGYATGSFSFTNVSLGEITSYLEKAFGVSILFKNHDLSHCRMTAGFENKSLEYIMHVIAITLNIQYTFQTNKIYIDGHDCN